MMQIIADRARSHLNCLWVDSAMRGGALPPHVAAALSARVAVGQSLEVISAVPALGTATCRASSDVLHRVDLSAPLSRLCSCGECAFGWPCCHVCAVLPTLGRSVDDFIDVYLTRAAEVAGFRAMGVAAQVDTADEVAVPLGLPALAAQGHPHSKKRRVYVGDGRDDRRRCRSCGEAGHNARTCGHQLP